MPITNLKNDLQKLANIKQAEVLQHFFKTGKGEYGEGDIFLGIKVPEQRKIVKKYKDLDIKNVEKLLKSKIHEHRLVAILILVLKYTKGDDKLKKQIYNVYLKNTKYINNWDLVDLSAPNIVGDYLFSHPLSVSSSGRRRGRDVLYKLAKSKSLWERRIAVLATFTFIRNNDFKDILKLAELLLSDTHDLMHKAVGWMLREMGKRDQKLLEKFLDKNIRKMPRTMLRYSIEKFDEEKRQYYLKK